MKIVIVGGGTAGWITAAFFVKHTKGHDVTVIESSKIPIIGAGEGSTGSLPWFVKTGSVVGETSWADGLVNEMDFLRKTKATLKLGIRMQNWKGDGTHYYSPFHGSPTDTLAVDSTFLTSILKYDKSHFSSLHSWMMDDKLSTFTKRNDRISVGLDNHSYHFDGHEVGKYFKEVCIKKGIKVIDSEVTDTQFDTNEYLQSIKLANGDTINSDFWFDCTGFSKVLMGKTKNKWVSYKDNLPTNTAVPFSTDVFSKTVKFETHAEAMNAGWMWRIPLQNRYGNGYVFSDEFQSYDKSVEEVEKKLGHSIEPIKTIKFEPGRYEKTWYNNIAAVGLSSHFLEPLEATAIHISIISVSNLLFHFLKTKECIVSESNRNKYNTMINSMIDDYKDFIQMHYLTGRDDTPFWKFIKNELVITDKNKEYIELSKFRLLNRYDISTDIGTPGWPLWSHILHNAGLFDKDMVKTELESYNETFNGEYQFKKMMGHYDKIKKDLVPTEEFFKYLKK
jgi:tryptophan halogenase